MDVKFPAGNFCILNEGVTVYVRKSIVRTEGGGGKASSCHTQCALKVPITLDDKLFVQNFIFCTQS